VLSKAASVRPVTLHAINAIHLASAWVLRQELTSFVSYDKRLLAAAKEPGCRRPARPDSGVRQNLGGTFGSRNQGPAQQ